MKYIELIIKLQALPAESKLKYSILSSFLPSASAKRRVHRLLPTSGAKPNFLSLPYDIIHES